MLHSHSYIDLALDVSKRASHPSEMRVGGAGTRRGESATPHEGFLALITPLFGYMMQLARDVLVLQHIVRLEDCAEASGRDQVEEHKALLWSEM